MSTDPHLARRKEGRKLFPSPYSPRAISIRDLPVKLKGE